LIKKTLGRVELSSLFLQQFAWYLYKAEHEKHSYSIRTGENVVEMPNKRCPKGSIKYFLLFVARY